MTLFALAVSLGAHIVHSDCKGQKHSVKVKPEAVRPHRHYYSGMNVDRGGLHDSLTINHSIGMKKWFKVQKAVKGQPIRASRDESVTP